VREIVIEIGIRYSTTSVGYHGKVIGWEERL